MNVTIAAACVPDSKGDKQRNFTAAAAVTRRLASEGARIVVLPEACLQGYPAADERWSRDELLEMAEPFDGHYARAFRDLARETGVFLVAGYDRREGQNVFNSAELIGPDGQTVGLYDKTHATVPPDTRLYTPGSDLPVFETPFGKVGLLICIDRTYPECWRVLMLQGARMVLIPACGGYSQLNTGRLLASSHDNCLVCVFAHPKMGLVITPDGQIVDQGGEEDKPFAIGTVDLGDVDERHSNLRRRRRVDLYGCILDR